MRKDNNKLGRHAGTGKTVRKCGNLALIETEEWVANVPMTHEETNPNQAIFLKHVIIREQLALQTPQLRVDAHVCIYTTLPTL